MDVDDVRSEWENASSEAVTIKEEIVSEDEDVDERQGDDDESHASHSNDRFCYFFKEEPSNFDFEEEVEDSESNRTSFNEESNDVKLEPVSVKTELLNDEIMIPEDPTISTEEHYLEEKVEVSKNESIVEKPPKKKYRSRYRTFSLFAYASKMRRPEPENMGPEKEDDDKNSESTNLVRRKAFPCSKCRLYYMTQANLDAHLANQKCNEKPSFECAICGNQFYRKRNLGNHILRMHSDREEFKCEMCLKIFVKKSLLDCHLKAHSGKKMVKCDQCDSLFYDKNALYYHKKKHSTERPFTCHICNMSFKFKGVLKTHMQVHLDAALKEQKVFQCDMCPQSFPRGSQLKKHVRVHAYQQYKFHLCPTTS